jgi:hypothetical protein
MSIQDESRATGRRLSRWGFLALLLSTAVAAAVIFTICACKVMP